MNLALYFLIGIIALLYSSVGHGGATGYLAVMSFWDIKPDVMASTALILNILTATISFAAYSRNGFISFKLISPFLLSSIPMAYLGAIVNLKEEHFSWLLGIILLASAGKLWFFKAGESEEKSFVESPSLPIALLTGSLLGFIAGAIGIGGGVFLSPVIVLFGWADPKTTSGCAALFIVVNSLTGLAARAAAGRVEIESIIPFLIFAFLGSVAGSLFGSRYSSNQTLRKLISCVLVLAVFKLFFA